MQLYVRTTQPVHFHSTSKCNRAKEILWQNPFGEEYQNSTWYLVLYLESSDITSLGNIPIAWGVNFDYGKLPWFPIYLRPYSLASNGQGKFKFRTISLLNNFHFRPLVYWGWIFIRKSALVWLSVESCFDQNFDYSALFVDPQCRSSFSNDGTTLATCRNVKNLCVSIVVVTCWLELKSDFPFFG